MAKPSTWTITNGKRVLHPKANAATDIAVTVTGDSIVKNGKPTDGKTINLTVAHLRSGATVKRNDTNGTITIVRTEGSRGRKKATDVGNDAFNEFLNRFNS